MFKKDGNKFTFDSERQEPDPYPASQIPDADPKLVANADSDPDPSIINWDP